MRYKNLNTPPIGTDSVYNEGNPFPLQLVMSSALQHAAQLWERAVLSLQLAQAFLKKDFFFYLGVTNAYELSWDKTTANAFPFYWKVN